MLLVQIILWFQNNRWRVWQRRTDFMRTPCNWTVIKLKTNFRRSLQSEVWLQNCRKLHREACKFERKAWDWVFNKNFLFYSKSFKLADASTHALDSRSIKWVSECFKTRAISLNFYDRIFSISSSVKRSFKLHQKVPLSMFTDKTVFSSLVSF